MVELWILLRLQGWRCPLFVGFCCSVCPQERKSILLVEVSIVAHLLLPCVFLLYFSKKSGSASSTDSQGAVVDCSIIPLSYLFFFFRVEDSFSSCVVCPASTVLVALCWPCSTVLLSWFGESKTGHSIWDAVSQVPDGCSNHSLDLYDYPAAQYWHSSCEDMLLTRVQLIH